MQEIDRTVHCRVATTPLPLSLLCAAIHTCAHSNTRTADTQRACSCPQKAEVSRQKLLNETTTGSQSRGVKLLPSCHRSSFRQDQYCYYGNDDQLGAVFFCVEEGGTSRRKKVHRRRAQMQTGNEKTYARILSQLYCTPSLHTRTLQHKRTLGRTISCVTACI